MKTVFPYVLIILLTNSCCRKPLISNDDRDLWRKDSIACNNSRDNLYRVILKKKEFFIGESRKEIEKYFGSPNVEQASDSTKKYYYFVEKGPQCLYTDKNGYDSLSVEVLFIFFDKADKVKLIGGMRP
jgi:hypothetical protein